MYWIDQGHDSCCFVYAVANFQIWCGLDLPDLEKAKDVAFCRHGATIKHQDVVDYFGASLSPTKNKEDVFLAGGIININHPIWNGHSFLVFPDEEGITAINSWLGPLEASNIGTDELTPFVCTQFGDFWYKTGV